MPFYAHKHVLNGDEGCYFSNVTGFQALLRQSAWDADLRNSAVTVDAHADAWSGHRPRTGILSTK